MRKIVSFIILSFFLASCGGTTNNATVLNRLSNGYTNGWSNQVNQKVEMSFLGLDNQQYFDYYHLQKRLSSLTGGLIDITGSGSIFTGSGATIDTGSGATGSGTTGSGTTGSGAIDLDAWNDLLNSLSGSLDSTLTWTDWLAIPGHNPHVERGVTNLRYDFIAQHGEAYNFRIYIYGSNGWSGDGNTGWLVSPSVLKIDTVKPLYSSINYIAGNTNSDLGIIYLGYDELSGVDAIEIVESPDSSFSDGNDVVLATITDFSSGFTSYIVPVAGREGQTYYYGIRVYDAANNTRDAIGTDAVTYDTIAPTATVTYTLADGNPYIPGTTWANQDIAVSIKCSDATTGCDMGSSFNDKWTITGDTATRTFSSDNNSINKNVRLYDNTGNSTLVNYGELKIDKTIPTSLDISVSHPDNTDFLATDSQNIRVNVSENGGSPISEIRAFFEDFNSSTGAYISSAFTSINGVLDENYNIKKVDNMRESNGSRQYSLKVTKICDEAGNCLESGDDETSSAGVVNYNYNVYPNTQVGIVSSIDMSALSDSSNIADDISKDVIITLKDAYGNDIIPALGISRTIGFNITANNTLKINQYNDAGESALYIGTQEINIGGSNFTLNNQNSYNGEYTLPFYIYAPTQGIWNARIDNITFNTQDDLTGYIPGQSINGTIASSGIIAKPLYTTHFSGELVNTGFREGATQVTELEVVKHAPFASISNDALRLEFGSGTFMAPGEENISYNLKESGISINEGAQASWSTLSSIGSLITKNLSTFMVQEGVLNGGVHSYLASILSYRIDMNKNGVYDVNETVIYPGDLIGSGSTVGNSYQTTIKILGNTSSQNTQNLTQDQFQKDVRIFGSIEKSDVRRDIQKSVYSIIRNAPLDNGTPSPYSVSSSSLAASTWSELGDGKVLQNGQVLYFGNLLGDNVEVSGTANIQGTKTLVVEGGNIYIKGNITGNGILGLIALQKDGQGGNIYISPSVIDIHAMMYADKSLMSYNGVEIDGNTLGSADILKNQLYIYGSIFSENTIGGSRKSTPECPYYVNIGCTSTEEAQKYDLNFLRRYYRYDAILPLDGIPDTIANGGNPSNARGKSGFEDYPVVVDYNPQIQETPPPFFK